jgi:hypothetical protein
MMKNTVKSQNMQKDKKELIKILIKKRDYQWGKVKWKEWTVLIENWSI